MISEDKPVDQKGRARLKWREGQEAIRAGPTRRESAVTSARLFSRRRTLDYVCPSLLARRLIPATANSPRR